MQSNTHTRIASCVWSPAHTHAYHHISMPYMNQGRDKILKHAVASHSELFVQGHADVISRLRTGLSSHSSQPVATLRVTLSTEQLQPCAPQGLQDPSLHPDS